MEGLYLQALFSTPGMVSVFVIVILLQAASLLFFWATSYEFRKMMRRHEVLFEAMRGNGQHKRAKRSSRIIFGIYVITTVTVTAITTALFIFQPHLL